MIFPNQNVIGMASDFECNVAENHWETAILSVFGQIFPEKDVAG
jgi:hypothetical protein